MARRKMIFESIGTIYTPFKKISDMPIQPIAAEGVTGSIEIFPEYVKGLEDLEGFSHISLLYYFHKITGYNLKVKPFMDTEEHGIFATRSPKRPNAIGISTVELLGIENNILHIRMADMLNETPLIDIKPFFEKFDNRFETRAGWLEKNSNAPVDTLRSDDRFK